MAANRVVQILMKRDNMTEEDATRLLRATQDEIDEMMAQGCSSDEIEDIIKYDLGLEMDYIFDVLYS